MHKLQMYAVQSFPDHFSMVLLYKFSHACLLLYQVEVQVTFISYCDESVSILVESSVVS